MNFKHSILWFYILWTHVVRKKNIKWTCWAITPIVAFAAVASIPATFTSLISKIATLHLFVESLAMTYQHSKAWIDSSAPTQFFKFTSISTRLKKEKGLYFLCGHVGDDFCSLRILLQNFNKLALFLNWYLVKILSFELMTEWSYPTGILTRTGWWIWFMIQGWFVWQGMAFEKKQPFTPKWLKSESKTEENLPTSFVLPKAHKFRTLRPTP